MTGSFNKQKQTLTLVFVDKKEKIHRITFTPDEVTSGVEWGGDRTSLSNSHIETRQDNGTMPTQFPDGDHNIESIADTTDPSKYGSKWLTTDASQYLSVVDENGNPTGKTVKDFGYYIHFTIYKNTHGCIGIFNKLVMTILLKAFEKNKETSDPSATLHVTGDPSKYENSVEN
ncbi:hypothetical protein H0R92_09990 [Treponema sp. OMZ 840]